MKKFLQVLVVFFVVISCAKDTFEDKVVDDSSARLAASQFDNSYMGVYKGLFSTNDGLTRGSVVVTLTPSNEGIAQITLSTGDIIELRSAKAKLTVDNTVSNLRFSSAGLSAIDATLDFSVEGDGIHPVVSNVKFANQESDIFIAKNLSRAPLTPITGTYVRTAGTGGFPNSNRTWNVMAIGAGDGQTFATQIAYGGRVYNTGPVSVQFGCSTSAGYTTCQIGGSTSILGHVVTWTGTHKYNEGSGANEPQCAQVNGTWSAPTFGNSSGTFTSDTTCSGAAVANDSCAGAIAINGPGTYTGSTTNATTTGSPTGCADDLSFGKGVWYRYTTNVFKVVTVTTVGTSFDTILGVFSGSCAALTCVGSNDDISYPSNVQSSIAFSATPSVNYYIYIVGYDAPDFGDYSLNVTEFTPGPGDICQTALPIVCGTPATGTTTGGTTSAPATCTTTLNTAPGKWYSFSTATADAVVVNTVGSNFDTKLGVFRGTCSGLICVGGNDDGPTGVTPQSQVTFTATPNTTYYIYVTGYQTNTGNYTLNVNCTPPPPPLTCGNTFVDHAGATTNYSNNRNDTYYFDAGAGMKVSLPFTQFLLETGWDFMRIYNSTDGVTKGTEITTVGTRTVANISATRYGFTGTTNGTNSLQGQTVVSAGRYLIITFTSDNTGTAAGWQSTVGCVVGRLADDSHIKTSETFMPPISASIPKAISNEGMSEADRIIERDMKKQEAYDRMLQQLKERKLQESKRKKQ